MCTPHREERIVEIKVLWHLITVAVISCFTLGSLKGGEQSYTVAHVHTQNVHAHQPTPTPTHICAHNVSHQFAVNASFLTSNREQKHNKRTFRASQLLLVARVNKLPRVCNSAYMVSDGEHSHHMFQVQFVLRTTKVSVSAVQISALIMLMTRIKLSAFLPGVLLFSTPLVAKNGLERTT